MQNHYNRYSHCLLSVFFLFLSLMIFSEQIKGQEREKSMNLKIDKSGHFLIREDGEPFFWLGDTAWELFAKLDRNEVLRYLEDRKGKHFNVIQARALNLNIERPNAYGHKAFHDGDSGKPNEDYWKHCDFIIEKAKSLELYIALLPAWGHVEKKRNSSKDILLSNPERAYRYGLFIGHRYRSHKNIIWVLGGDIKPTRHKVYDALARGITEGAGQGKSDNVLMSYHPPGGTYRPPATSTGEFYHNKPWLDFNMIQSGHRIGNKNYERIMEDYYRTPPKPTLDAEPCYEHHPVKHNFKNGEFSAWHLRRRAYWSILAGAFGFTYGANGIYQMDKPNRIHKRSHHKFFWYDALNFEGAGQMKFVRQLFESRPFHIPDQSIILSSEGTVDDRVQAARATDNSYWIIYITNGHSVDLDLSKVSGLSTNAWWFNPRDGLTYTTQSEAVRRPFDIFQNDTRQSFDPPRNPGADNDWILVIDDAARGYPAPGAVSNR